VNLHSAAIRPVSYDKDSLGFPAAALNVEFLVGLIGSYCDVGELQITLLDALQHPCNDVIVRMVTRSVELRAEIMMIKNELLTEELVWRCNQEKRVGWIVRVDYIKAVPDRNIDAHTKASTTEINVLGEISENGLELNQYTLDFSRIIVWRELAKQLQARDAIDLDSINYIRSSLPFLSQSHDDSGVPGRCEHITLIFDPRILGKCVLNEHQDSES